MNATMLLGVIVSEPEELPSSRSKVCRLTLRTTRRWYNEEGPREVNTFHRLQFYDGQARVALDHGKVGDTMWAIGSIQTMTDSERRYVQFIQVHQFQFLRVKRERVTCPPAANVIYLADQTTEQ